MAETLERLERIRQLRKDGHILGELFDAGYSATEIVEALGVMPLAHDLGLLEESKNVSEREADMAENETRKQLLHELYEAESKAFDAMSRYKFQMFGYWAAIWVHLNRIGDFKRPNPFQTFVQNARIEVKHRKEYPPLEVA